MKLTRRSKLVCFSALTYYYSVSLDSCSISSQIDKSIVLSMSLNAKQGVVVEFRTLAWIDLSLSCGIALVKSPVKYIKSILLSWIKDYVTTSTVSLDSCSSIMKKHMPSIFVRNSLSLVITSYKLLTLKCLVPWRARNPFDSRSALTLTAPGPVAATKITSWERVRRLAVYVWGPMQSGLTPSLSVQFSLSLLIF